MITRIISGVKGIFSLLCTDAFAAELLHLCITDFYRGDTVECKAIAQSIIDDEIVVIIVCRMGRNFRSNCESHCIADTYVIGLTIFTDTRVCIPAFGCRMVIRCDLLIRGCHIFLCIDRNIAKHLNNVGGKSITVFQIAGYCVNDKVITNIEPICFKVVSLI